MSMHPDPIAFWPTVATIWTLLILMLILNRIAEPRWRAIGLRLILLAALLVFFNHAYTSFHDPSIWFFGVPMTVVIVALAPWLYRICKYCGHINSYFGGRPSYCKKCGRNRHGAVERSNSE